MNTVLQNRAHLFLMHRSGDFFFNLTTREANFGGKTFFLSSLQTSLGFPVTSFFKKMSNIQYNIYFKPRTFFLRETFIYNDGSKSFFFVERHQLYLLKTINISD